MRCRFFLNDLKCQTKIESFESVLRSDSRFPLQIDRPVDHSDQRAPAEPTE